MTNIPTIAINTVVEVNSIQLNIFRVAIFYLLFVVVFRTFDTNFLYTQYNFLKIIQGSGEE